MVGINSTDRTENEGEDDGTMGGTQFDLLKRRRFLPLFVTQFLGAFNDNVFKNALLILITYGAAQKGHGEEDAA